MQERYSRQILFDGIGEEGQQNLQKKHVLIVGAGALGTGNAEILTRAGVGRLTIVDRDYVEVSNLQRQQLYTERDANDRIPKAIAAQKRLREINPYVEVDGKIMDVTVEEIDRLVSNVDLIIDATDNFEIRFLINDVSQKHRIPWIYGGCVSSYGISFTVLPGETPCLNCLLETIPLGGATCDTVGVIAPAVQMVVAYQSAEALKILVEDFEAVRRKLVSFDLWKNEQSAIDVSRLRKEDCPSCGTSPTYPYLSYENQTKTAVLCGRNTVQIRPPKKVNRDLNALVTQLENQGGAIEQNPFLVSYQSEDRRVVFFKDGRVLIHGMKDIVEAKKIYHQLLG
ncbi:thiazole biosynthesis adenylyltransferase ThiF [Alkalibacillus haloalkaliphilus]|uniref:thiazole biosynthesis adenylyltransferase ThiF n=1 Tax=Alkalibacillus haloalkaliphilus TaxID=94136 RepID=UPI002936AFFB|nr:thiazole biosynthesis adenylyltransferase ThiF [Alkalibacillus haloalkaliphilus]MDV2581782.1 thiazole biosynthesis adenylyltransferase ThiF [Alkalibacillus haloalkaliphilus]